MKYILSIFSVVLMSSISFAQPISNSSYDQLVASAELAIEVNDYYNAVEYYELAYKEERDLTMAHTIATLHTELRSYAKAERWWLRIVNKKDTRKVKNTFMPEARFDYACILKLNGKYQESVEQFNLYISEAEDIEKVKLAKIYLEGAKMGLEMDEEPGISITNAGKKVNSKYSEASPYLVNGSELYFAGYRRSDLLVLDGKEDDMYSTIFVANKTGNEFSEAEPIGGINLPRDGYHLGNLAISPDGSRMYFTRATLEGNKLSTSELYYSTKGAEGWGPAYPLEKINGDYRVRQPALGELYNKQVLFFTSDKDGGYGGYDIYYATFDGETFVDPVNLGKGINTPGNEESPYYIDGTLYFSSDRLPGLGGFDIFNTLWDGSTWSKPNNIGKPYNSSVDDKYFIIDRDGYEGMVVSNREGTSSVESKTCCDDIWFVSKEKIVLELMTTMFNVETKEPLNGVKIDLLNYTADAIEDSKTRIKQDTNSYSFGLVPDKAYRVIASREGFYPDTLEFNTVDVTESQVFNKNISLTPVPPPPPEPEEEYEEYTINEPIRLNNIYYDYDDDKILLDAEQDLTIILELMNQYPELVIELSSHTDSRGLTGYNEDLSQRRANSAKAWLLGRGVADDRINAVGYGESQILNQCVNGVKCDDEEHRFNRRTEFKIISGPTTIQIKKTRLIKKTN